MGATLWAEWLAFMEARGLEWDGVRNPPAGPLPADWNVVAFPRRGEELQRAKLTNTFIRARLKSLDSNWWGVWELLKALPNGEKLFGPHFGQVQKELDQVWDTLVEMRAIEAGHRPSRQAFQSQTPPGNWRVFHGDSSVSLIYTCLTNTAAG